MTYLIVEDGIITNIIVADESFATQSGAVAFYEGAEIGLAYNPPTEQIAALKAQLSASDYKVIKCAECSLAGLPAPYDIAALNAERQAIRDQINALEATI